MSNQQKFSFPTFNEVYPCIRPNIRFLKWLRQSLRYYTYRALHYKPGKDLLYFLAEHPIWAALFKQDTHRYNTLIMTYCDKSFNAAQRVNTITTTFDVMERKLGKRLCEELVNNHKIILSPLADNLFLYLTINPLNVCEGFFSLSIHDELGNWLYGSSFSFLSDGELLISSIQGPKNEDAQELVKQTTKKLHGVRPMFMIVNAFRLFCQNMNLHYLYGIRHKSQGKYRWNDHSRLLFNYDDFWQENNAQRQSNGYWRLALNVERKPLEDIASKKRSMYRKRYEMFDLLEQSLTTLLQK